MFYISFYISRCYFSQLLRTSCNTFWKKIFWWIFVLLMNSLYIDQNIKERCDLMELHFEGVKMQKWIVPTDRFQIVDEKKLGSFVYLSCLLKKISQFHLNFLPKLRLIFVVISRKYKKSHILNFNKHNSGSKHDFYHLLKILTPFFSFTLRALSVGWSRLYISRTSKFHFKGPAFVLCSDLWNTHLLASDDILKSVNIDILFLHKIY